MERMRYYRSAVRISGLPCLLRKMKIERGKLKRCRDLREEAEQYEQMILERQPSIAARMDGMPRGTAIGKPTEDKAVELISLETLMLSIVEEHRRLVSEITTACKDLDSASRRIILMRYVDGLTWAEISDATSYSVRWVYDLHNKAVDEISY